jgi:galactose oxidase-like protein
VAVTRRRSKEQELPWAFKDTGVSSEAGTDCGGNQVLAENIVNFVVPVPERAPFALVGLGVAAIAGRRSRRSRPVSLALLTSVIGLAIGSAEPARAICTGTPAQCTVGEFGNPFEEPTLLGINTPERCLEDSEGVTRCKVTAGSLIALADDRFLYWNALEGTEDVEVSLIAEFGYVTANDQSRLLTLGTGDQPSWVKPTPVDGGAVSNPDGIGPCNGTTNGGADAALFCSDQKMLHDGRVLAAGGTDYYNDSCVDWESLEPNPLPFTPGAAELEGIKNARIFNPATNTWTQTDSMEFGRWYPAAVTLADGDVFIASGVTRLVKPVYPDAPLFSGRNVFQTETYDTACGTWSNNGTLAEHSLPLFPRMHLLPNGHVYYNAGGQAFNPFGQAYDELLWNIVASYDPVAKTWTDHAIAGFPLQLSSQGLQSISSELNPTNPNGLSTLLQGLAGRVVSDPQGFAELLDDQALALLDDLLGMDLSDPNVAMAILGGGFRGSTFSVMLPLRPDANGNYSKASFLTAGGIQSTVVNPSPGSYVATALSRIDTMDLSGSMPVYSSKITGSLHAPRWYGYGTLLPNGQVIATSGADRDEVMTPGAEIPVRIAELFDPATDSWSQVDTQNRARTYHNSALLMRDGRVLVGGHAPITNSYMAHRSLGEPFAPNEGRDPSFEIYSPWYVFRSDRPVITSVSTRQLLNGGTFSATVQGATANLHSVVLMRRTATTHLVDGDQRAVVLRVLSANGLNGSRVLAIPDTSVLPPGQYVLYANIQALDGKVVPSKGVSVTVGAGVVGSCQ